MYLTILACSAAVALALPSQPSTTDTRSVLRIDLPDSPSVMEVLGNPELYEQLSSPFKQSPLKLAENVFTESQSKCGTSPVCPSYEGKEVELNGRKYKLYCYNAPWGAYIWLPTTDSLEKCEAQCHQHSYDCNGLTFYPSTGVCSLIYSKDSQPYIWDNGVQKIGAIPADAEPAFGPGMVCPLPASDNQVYQFGPDKFKLSCTNQFKVPAAAKKNLGRAKNVDECAEKCEKGKCYGFHYYQPYFPGGAVDGVRTCEIITQPIEQDQWTPVYKPNQYLAGLRVGSSKCGDPGWEGNV